MYTDGKNADNSSTKYYIIEAQYPTINSFIPICIQICNHGTHRDYFLHILQKALNTVKNSHTWISFQTALVVFSRIATSILQKLGLNVVRTNLSPSPGMVLKPQ